MRRTCQLMVCLAVLPWQMLGQSAARPEFEVASIKESRRMDQGYQMGVAPLGNRFTAQNSSLLRLILWAYDMADWQLAGGPAWLGTARFDIDAKPERPTTREDFMLMLQALLAERFQLKMRRETKEGSLYVLSVDKGGPHLTPHQGELGFQQAVRIGAPGHAAFQNVRMPRFAWFLKTQLGRTVIDRTELTGNYDFKLDWTTDDQASRGDSGPTLSVALREQLGLKLEAQKGSVDYFVIERADKPSGN